MKDIITIGCQLPGHSDRYASFTSRKSILDADIVLITPEIGEYEFLRASDPFFQGKICYGENGSYKLREDMDYWKRSLNTFLMHGNTVFLILDSKRDFFLTQNRTIEGKGRTARENINVVSGNSYMFLPFQIGEVISAEGEHVISCHNPYFTEFDKKFGQQLSYKAYISHFNTEQGIPLYKTKKGNKILGALLKAKLGNGHLIILPYLDLEQEGFIEYNNDEALWTQDAIQFGHQFIECIVHIDQNLRSASNIKAPIPLWVNGDEYKLKAEDEIKQQLKDKEVEQEKILTEIKALEENLLFEQALKDLLFETGTSLEKAVIVALKILGYQAEGYHDGRLEIDQVIISPEGQRYIGECEGKDREAINVSKFRQLQDMRLNHFCGVPKY